MGLLWGLMILQEQRHGNGAVVLVVQTTSEMHGSSPLGRLEVGQVLVTTP